MSVYLSFSSSILLSVAAAYFLRIDIGLYTAGSSLLIGSFVIFLLITTIRAVWICFVYPKYWSSLRHLPQPSDRPSLLMGHFWQMIDAGPGVVLRSWANSVPNNGVIRYLDFFNLERVAVVSPAALAEVLVHKCYDFEKPPQLRKGISRILGMGLFLSEGDVHKVSGQTLASFGGTDDEARSKESTSCRLSRIDMSRTCTPCSGTNPQSWCQQS